MAKTLAGRAPAVRPGRCGVRGDAAHRAPVVLELVRAGEQATRHQRLDPGRPRIDRVGTDVAGDVRVEGEQRAVVGETGPHEIAVVPGVGGREQVLGPVLHPLHRHPRHRLRDHAQRDVLGVQHGLDAEPAAHVRRDDPEVALGQVQQLGEHVAHDVRDLGAVPERQVPVGGLPERDAGAALHGVPTVPVGDELTLDDERGAGQRGLDVPDDLEVRRVRDDDPGAAVGEDVGELRARRTGVDAHGDPAGAGHSEVGLGDLHKSGNRPGYRSRTTAGPRPGGDG
jgi:hypothetical protein